MPFHTPRIVKADHGATMVEMSLVLLLLLMFVMGVVNVGRFMAIQAVLTRGAQESLNLAQKVDGIEVDTRKLAPTDPNYSRFTSSRAVVVNQAKRIPLSTLISDVPAQSSAWLRPFQAFDDMAGDVTLTQNVDVLLLRPGDSAKYTKSGHTYWKDHPTLCSPDSPTCAQPISPTDSYDQLLRTHPLKIELRAEVDLFFPFNVPITVTGKALGFREQALTPSTPAQQSIPNDYGTGKCSGSPNIAQLTTACQAKGLCFDGSRWDDSDCCNACPGDPPTTSVTVSTQPYTCTPKQLNDCSESGGVPEPSIIQCCKRGSN